MSGQYCSAEMPNRDHNLYVIGSPKVNGVTSKVMEMIQLGSKMYWRFGPSPGYEPKGNYPVSLYRVDANGEEEKIGKIAQRGVGEVHIEDYGIIMRGPHPRHAGRMLLVMAGSHSLGTGAACIAATRSHHIRQIKEHGIDISHRQLAFWVLVRGVESKRDSLLDVDGVSIEGAGVYSNQ